MTSVPHPTLCALKTALHAQSRPRLWSLVVTILGDVAHPRGDWLAMSALHEIIADLGFESGALRTAMSRLSGDGWVERRKEGRNSWYRLGQSHYDEFLTAANTVYSASGAICDGPWQITVLAPGDVAPNDNCGWVLRPGVTLSQTHATSGAVTLIGDIAALAHWAHQVIAPDAHGQRLSSFSNLLAGVSLDQAAALAPRQAMALRILMIHEWRRLMLRHAPVPKKLAPDNWPEFMCRQRVAALYRVLFNTTEGRTCTDRFIQIRPTS